MSKKSIIKGTFILTFAGFLVKILGLYNRIFLTNLIGVTELGIYQLIFPLFFLGFSFTGQGLSITVSKYTSRYKHNPSILKSVLWTSFLYAICSSFIIALGIYIFSGNIAIEIIHNKDTAILLRLISPVIITVALKSVMIGFFLGNQKSGIIGFITSSEQIFRLILYIILPVFSFVSSSTSMFATYVFILGEYISFAVTLCLFICKYPKLIPQNNPKNIQVSFSTKSIIKEILLLSLNRGAITILSSFKTICIKNSFTTYYSSENVALSLFGIIDGIVMPFILFPGTLTSNLSTILLPELSRISKDKTILRKYISVSIRICVIIGCMSYIFFKLTGQLLCNLMFSDSYAGKILSSLAFVCPFIYTSHMIATILISIDRVGENMLICIISQITGIGLTLYLISHMGLYGYIVSEALYNVLQLILLYVVLRKCIKDEA